MGKLVLWLIYFFGLEPSNLYYAVDSHLENQLYLYLVICNSNYGNKEVFKVGFSHDVELHLGSQLSADAIIDDRSCKFKLEESEAKAFKNGLKAACAGHNLKCKSNFGGKSDWYYWTALERANIFVSDMVNMHKFKKQGLDLHRLAHQIL